MNEGLLHLTHLELSRFRDHAHDHHAIRAYVRNNLPGRLEESSSAAFKVGFVSSKLWRT
jgi:hypothetical protein